MELVMYLVAAISVGLLVWWFVMDDNPPVKADKTVKEVVEESVLPAAEQLKKMNKAQIEEIGRQNGIELDRRKTKSNMITDLLDS